MLITSLKFILKKGFKESYIPVPGEPNDLSIYYSQQVLSMTMKRFKTYNQLLLCTHDNSMATKGLAPGNRFFLLYIVIEIDYEPNQGYLLDGNDLLAN